MRKSVYIGTLLTFIIAIVVIFTADGFSSPMAIAGYVILVIGGLQLLLEYKNPVVKGFKPELSESELQEIREKRESLGLVKTVKALRIQHRSLGLAEATEIVREA